MSRAAKREKLMSILLSGFACALHKANEERMRLVRTGFEFGMKLYPYVEVAFGQFHRFHDMSARGRSADGQSRLLKRFFIVVVEFVSVTMPFFDQGLSESPI